MLSGRYQARFGYHTNVMPHIPGGSHHGIKASETLISERLKAAGYRTGLIGKWHLGARADFNPTRHGFDYFYGFPHEGRYYVRPPWDSVTTLLRRKTLPDGKTGMWAHPNGKLYYHDFWGRDEPLYDLNNPMHRNMEVIEEKRYLTDAFTDEAVRFIDRNKDRPFLLYLAYNAVHSPMQGADAYMKKMSHIKDIQRRIFAAMLANMDDSVGKVMKKLRDEKLEENTLVFFLSDNGGPTEELTSSNAPLKGGKGSHYEGGIRIPFLVQWKGTLPAGKVYDHPVISLDIYATAAEAAGRPAPDDSCDGVNLVPFLTGDQGGRPHDRLFWYFYGAGALRDGDWKIVKNDWRKDRFELYNLANDLSEQRDLSGIYKDRFQRMRQEWKAIVDTMPPR
jgi:arylsulfatase B